MTRVVAILAHPDDAEILAGGTLYKHRQRGDSGDRSEELGGVRERVWSKSWNKRQISL